MTQTETPTRIGFPAFAARRPVTAFALIGLPLAYALMGIPMLAEYDVIPGKGAPGAVGLTLEEVGSILLVASIDVTALWITWASDGRDGVRILLRRATRWRVSLRWWLLATLALPAGSIALAVLFGDQASVPSASTLVNEAVALLIALALVNMWEEGTWTGFVQTRLERRFNIFVAAAIATIPFALVHLPIRVITREATTADELLNAFIVLVIFCLFIRTLFAVITRGAANSVLLAAVTHTVFNRSNNVDGLVADVLSGPNQPFAALLTTVILTVVVVIVNRKRLGKAYRRQLDAAELAGPSVR